MQRMHPLNVLHPSVLITPKALIRHLMGLGGIGASPQGVQQSLQDQQRDLVFQQHQVVSLVVRKEIRPIGAEHRVIVCFKQEAAVKQHHVKEVRALHYGQLIRPLIAGPELPLHSLEGFEVDVGRVFRAIKEVEECTTLVVLHGLEVRAAVVQWTQRNKPGSEGPFVNTTMCPFLRLFLSV
ncbi:hypothetical protein AMTRI_Chr08g207400 [Amborella trichopoda]